MAFTPKILAQGQLSAVAGDIYSVPAATNTLVVKVALVNTSTSVRTVNLYIKSGATAARRIIPANLTLAAGFMLETDEYYTLSAAESIQADADVVSAVDYSIHGVEQT
ncbi:MAG: hypothetical protein ACREBG_21425 [Pyrinomonadaceae bacterium]